MHPASNIFSALFRLRVEVFSAVQPPIPDLPRHLDRNAPRLVSFALAALIAAEILRTAAPLLDSGAAGLERIALSAPPAKAAAAGVDVARIVSAHLFGDLRTEASAQDPARAPISASSLSLVGTIATPIPAVGIAIIGGEGQSKVYSVGDRIGDASLHLVYFDHVVLDRDGLLELLVLPARSTPFCAVAKCLGEVQAAELGGAGGATGTGNSANASRTRRSTRM